MCIGLGSPRKATLCVVGLSGVALTLVLEHGCYHGNCQWNDDVSDDGCDCDG